MPKPERRELHFETLDDLVADARAVALHPHETTGNWNASQIVLHVTDLIGLANHGPDVRLPLPVRLLGKVLRLFGMHHRPMPSGVKAPSFLDADLEAHAQVPVEEAVATLEREVAEAHATPMSHPNPLFGPLTHAQWVTMHCRHAELHFSFLRPIPELCLRLGGFHLLARRRKQAWLGQVPDPAISGRCRFSLGSAPMPRVS